MPFFHFFSIKSPIFKARTKQTPTLALANFGNNWALEAMAMTKIRKSIFKEL